MVPQPPPYPSFDGRGRVDLAHELPTALAVIKGHAQLLGRRLGRDEPGDRDHLRQRLATIDAATVRMTTLIAALPDGSRWWPIDGDRGRRGFSPPPDPG